MQCGCYRSGRPASSASPLRAPRLPTIPHPHERASYAADEDVGGLKTTHGNRGRGTVVSVLPTADCECEMQRDHLSGGPVDAVFAALEARFPGVVLERLQVSHPGDDDNLWFVRAHVDAAVTIQIETRPGGQPPFLVEGDDVYQRAETSGADEAVALAAGWSRAAEPLPPILRHVRARGDACLSATRLFGLAPSRLPPGRAHASQPAGQVRPWHRWHDLRRRRGVRYL
jgi:hypothetical protein